MLCLLIRFAAMSQSCLTAPDIPKFPALKVCRITFALKDPKVFQRQGPAQRCRSLVRNVQHNMWGWRTCQCEWGITSVLLGVWWAGGAP